MANETPRLRGTQGDRRADRQKGRSPKGEAVALGLAPPPSRCLAEGGGGEMQGVHSLMSLDRVPMSHHIVGGGAAVCARGTQAASTSSFAAPHGAPAKFSAQQHKQGCKVGWLGRRERKRTKTASPFSKHPFTHVHQEPKPHASKSVHRDEAGGHAWLALVAVLFDSKHRNKICPEYLLV